MPKPPYVNHNRQPSAVSAPAAVLDARLTELARTAGARRHGEVASVLMAGPTLPLPDAAMVVGLALQCVRLSGRVPLPVRDALEHLAASGEPTARMVLAWIGRIRPRPTSGTRISR